jgi:sphinganine C4-monooxygenase
MNSTDYLSHVYDVLEKPQFTEKITIVPRPRLLLGISDEMLALAMPIIAYWTYATFFHIIDVYELAEKYRIHPSEEEEARNKVTLSEVLRGVLLQHFIQTVLGMAVNHFEPEKTTGHELLLLWSLRKRVPSIVPSSFIYYGYFYIWPVVKFLIGITIIDSWQYWLHRLMHVNKSLYRRFHSRHHRLYVPYAYGALYNDPVEGFLLDSVGAALAGLVTQMTARETIFLYTFSTLKTVDDHCGYRLPYDFFQWIFPNNTIYHDIHHQIWGIKNNFSQPFFVFWDTWNNTNYKLVDEYKHYQNTVTLKKYKEFLDRKTGKSKTKKIKKR